MTAQFKGHVTFDPRVHDVDLDRRNDEPLRDRCEAQLLENDGTLPEGWQDVFERHDGRLFVSPCACAPDRRVK
jgi:hypothetical protein